MIEFETKGGKKFLVNEECLAEVALDPNDDRHYRKLRIEYRSGSATEFRPEHLDIEKLYALIRSAMSHEKNTYRLKPEKGASHDA